MQATLESPNGTMRPIKNLGWLRANWKSLARFEWSSDKPREGYPRWNSGLFTAYTHDGRIYRIQFSCFEVWTGFINRPIFRGLPVTVNGITGKV